LRVEQIPGFHMEIIEGRFSDARITPLLRLRGPMRSLLSAERVVLNFLQRMSGVATTTQLRPPREDTVTVVRWSGAIALHLADERQPNAASVTVTTAVTRHRRTPTRHAGLMA